MYRIAFNDGELTFDKNGNAIGRGVYLCKDDGCLDKAKKKNGLHRGFKRNFSLEMTDCIFEEIRKELSDA